MNLRKILLSSLTAVAATTIAAQSPIKFSADNRASIGVYIEEIATGKILEDYNADRTLPPASTMKSLTCATALNLLGGDYRYVTNFYLVGEKDNPNHSNLVIASGADPTTGSRHFRESAHMLDSVAAHLEKMGVSYIGGNIIYDDKVLPDGGIVPYWEVDDIKYSYGVGLYPVNWMDNYFEGDYVMPSPPAYFRQQLIEVLSMNEINVEGDSISFTAPTDTTLVFTHLSQPFSEIMHSLMVRSDNLMAEGTLRALAPAEPRDSAITLLKHFWQERGVDLSQTRILDGSGLSRANAIAPHQLGQMLTYMAKSDLAKEYVDLFARVGKEGTVKSFLTNTRLDGRMALKTGSLSGVQCYAGYLLDKNTEMPTHTVVIMIDHFYCNRSLVKKACENYLLKKLP